MLKSIQVRDYMTASLITLKADTDLFAAIDILVKHRISGAPVVDDNGHMIGMISEGDCLKGIIKDIYYEEAGGHVSDFMTTDVATVGPGDDIVDVAVAFNEQRLRRFPVVEDGELLGQISQHDVLVAVSHYNENAGHTR